MTTFTWTATASADWNTPSAWDLGSVPDGSTADAIIALLGTYAVQISSGEAFTVDSVTLNAASATLDVQGTLTLAGATDSVFLDAGTLGLDSGGTVTDGTIVADGGALQAQGGLLSGVTYQGELALAGSDQTLLVADGLTLDGGIAGNPGSIDLSGATDSGISVLGSETLDNAVLNFGAGSGDSLSSGTGDDSGNTLALASSFVIDVDGGNDYLGYQTGSLSVNDSGDALDNAGLISITAGSLTVDYGTFVNTGSISVTGDGLDVQNDATFDNAGTIDVEGTEGDLSISSTTFVNTGEFLVGNGAALYLASQSYTNAVGGTITIQAGGYMVLQGDITTSQLDGIASEGTISVYGTLDNAGQVLSVGPGTPFATWYLNYGDTISGGVIHDTGSGLVLNDGTLDGVTYEGTLGLGLPYIDLEVAQGLTLTGESGSGPGSANLGNDTYILFDDSQTLDNATLTLSGGVGSIYQNTTPDYYTSNGDQSGTLTLGPNLTVNQTEGEWYIGSEGSGYGSLANDGTIDLETGATELYVGMQTVTNSGDINTDASGGALVIEANASFLNTGEITAGIGSDGLVIGADIFTNAGQITAESDSRDVVLTPGTLINSGDIDIEAGSGRVVLAPEAMTNNGQIIVGADVVLDPEAATNPGSGTITVESGGTLELYGSASGAITIEAGGTLQLYGTVAGGTILAASGAEVESDGGTLAGVAFEGNLDLSASDSTLTLTDGTTLTGPGGSGPSTIALDNTGSYQTNGLYVLGTGTLDNAVIDIGGTGTGDQSLLVNEDTAGTGAVLTLGPNLTIDQVGDNATLGSSDMAGDGIVNEGTIDAGVAGGTLTIDGSNFTNDGLIALSNGDTIDFTGAPSAALISSVTNTGGVVQIAGTVTGGTILATGHVVGADGTLAGVTFDGTLDLSAPNTSFTLSGQNTFTGAGETGQATIDFNGPSDQSSYLYVLGTTTLDNAVIEIGNGGDGYNHLVNEDTAGTGAILTLGPNLILEQAGKTAVLNSSDHAGDGIVNDGTILAAVAGGIFYVDATNFANNGTIIVSNGDTIALEEAVTATLINSISKSGGMIEIGGTVDGGTIVAPTGEVGGTGGTLVGVTYEGTLDLSAANSSLTLAGGSSFIGTGGTGVATVNFSGAGNQYSYLYVLGSGTLDNAVINIGIANPGIYGQSNSLVNEDTAGTGAILTLGPNLTLNLVGYDAALSSSDKAGDGIVNEGTIIAGYAGGTLNIDATNFTNDGTIIVANGSYIDFTGAPTAAMLNSITNQGGVARIGGVVNGGTILAPTGGIGGEGGTLVGVTYEGTLDLSVANSSLTLTGGSSFIGAGGTGVATIDFSGAGNQYSYLYVLGSGTLDNAVINIGIANPGIYGQTNSLVNEDTAGTGATLTLGPNLTLNLVGYDAALSSSDKAGDGIVNEGTIIAEYAGATFTIDASNFTNDGTIIVANGSYIDFTGAPTAAMLNSITNQGGVARIGGVVNGGTILAPTGGIGGEGGTLVGVTYEGTLDLSAANSSLTLTGGSSFIGADGTGQAAINLAGQDSQSSYLYVLGTETLDDATINISYNDLVNEDTAGTGAILTLGPDLALNLAGYDATLSSSDKAGDGIVNDGTILAGYSGGTLDIDASNFSNNELISASNHSEVLIQGSSFTNGGSLSVGTDGTLAIESPAFTNLADNTLTGGTYEVGAGGTLVLPTNSSIQTDAADIILSGTGSVIESHSTVSGDEVQIDATLGTISTTGTLSLLGGRGFASTAGFTDDGGLQLGGGTFDSASLAVDASGLVAGYGTIEPTVTNDGTVTAAGGRLDIAGAVTGGGVLAIEAGATLELGAATAEAVTFSPPLSSDGTVVGGTLKLDAASGFTGTIAGLALGDVLDLADVAVTSASVSVEGTLVADISGGGTLSFALSGSVSPGGLQVASDGDGGTDLAVTNLAVVDVSTASPVDFGNVRVGSEPSQAISISNQSTSGGALLSASVIGAAGAATGSGSVSFLAPGAADSTDLLVGLNAGTAGVQSGEVTLGFTSYAGAGSPPLSDGSDTVLVQGTVYREAAYQVTAPGVLYLHAGDTATVGLGVRNTDPSDGYSEDLLASIISVTGSVAGASGTVEVSPGAISTSGLTATVTATAAGTFTGDAVVDMETDGQGIDGLGTANLGTVDVPVSYVVDNYATAALAQAGGDGTLTPTGTPGVYLLDLGTTEQSASPLSASLEVTNAAQGPAADVLGGAFTVSGTGFSNSGLGAFSGVSFGGTDTGPDIALGTGTIGTFTEQIVLDPTDSNPSGYSEAMPAETIDVVGTIVPSPAVVVSSISAPTDAQAGGQVPVTWTLTNEGSAAAVGPWVDAVYLASDAAGDNPTFIGTLAFNGTIAAGQSATREEIFTLPGALPPGDDWIVVRTDIDDQLAEPLSNAEKQAVASAPTDIAGATTLSVGSSVSGTLAAGQSAYYEMTLGPDQTVDLSLSSDDLSSVNGIYVAGGGVPTTTEYVVASSGPGTADPTLELAATSADDYYVMVANSSASGSETFTLGAVAPPFAISGVSASYGDGTGIVTLEVDGAQFSNGDQVQLVDSSGAVYASTAFDLVNSGEIWTTFNLGTLASGNYEVQVVNGTATATSPSSIPINGDATDGTLQFASDAETQPTYTFLQILRSDLGDENVATGETDWSEVASDVITGISDLSLGVAGGLLESSGFIAGSELADKYNFGSDLGIALATGYASAHTSGSAFNGWEVATDTVAGDIFGIMAGAITGAVLTTSASAVAPVVIGAAAAAVIGYAASKLSEATYDYFNQTQDGNQIQTTAGTTEQEFSDGLISLAQATSEIASGYVNDVQAAATQLSDQFTQIGTPDALVAQITVNELASGLIAVEPDLATALSDIWQDVSSGTVPPATGPSASLFPDPHLVTFDGLYYSFQTAGEFVLVEDTNGGTFQVQARLAAPVGTANYSVITEIGIQVGQDVVTIDSTRADPVWVDGQAVTFSGNSIGLADGVITKTATGFVVTLNTGESVTATIDSVGTQVGPATTSSGISVSVSLAPGTAHGSVEGLLGNYNGNPNNDLTLADGTVEPTDMSTATLYGVYADSWRVTQATSLLNYGPGQTTATFTDTDYPGTPLSISSFPTAEVAAATQLVEQSGITDPGLQQAAIYDYLVTGDPSIISVEENLEQQGAATTTQAQFTAPSPPPEQIGVQDAFPTVSEAPSGATSALFDVYAEGDTSQALTVGYTVVSPDNGYLGAADFGGVLPSGQITLAAGQTLAELSIIVPDGVGSAVSKNLEVEITAGTSVSVIAPYAQETIVNSAPVAGPPPVLDIEIQNDADLIPVRSGNSFTFDLGASKEAVATGLPTVLSLAVLNDGTGGSDAISGAIAASGNGGLATSPATTFTDVEPGTAFDIANVEIDSASLGVNTEQFVITPYDVNASGYVAIMAQETVTVTNTIYPLAQALLAATTIDFGAVRLGAVVQQAVGITNDGPAGAEGLDASVGTTTGAVTGSGAFSLLAVGQTSSAIAVGLDTSGAGVADGTVAIDLSSDGTDVDGLGATALLAQEVAVTGTVYREAVASVGALLPLVLHAGQTLDASIALANTAVADGYSEDLEGSVIDGPAWVAAVGAGSGDIAAGSSGSIALAVAPTNSGTYSGDVTLGLVSDGDPIDGLGTADLGTVTAAVTATVYNYATAAVALSGAGTLSGSGDAYTLDLGTVVQGSPQEALSLSLGNAADGLADGLVVSSAFSGGTSDFINSGYGSDGTVAAGQSSTALNVWLNTSATGTFSEELTFTLASEDIGGSSALAPVTIDVTGTVAAPSQGQVYVLTTGTDTVSGGPGPNTVIATRNALSSGDVIDAGPDGNGTLALVGFGVFNLTLPTTLTGIGTIVAQEGQSTEIINGTTFIGGQQILDLRPGMDNVTVDVVSGVANSGDPSPPTISITGAANNDLIELGSAADGVIMGQGETLYGGSGNDVIFVTASTISDVLNGGTGKSTLWFTGGGTATMGGSVTNFATAHLAAATAAWNFTANGIAGLVVQDASTTTADTLTAGGTGQTLSGGGAGKLTMVGATDTTFQDTAALFNGDDIKGFGAGDFIDVTGLAFASAGTGSGQTSLGLSGGELSVLVGGVTKTTIALAGTFNPNGFTLASDGNAGTLIGYHA